MRLCVRITTHLCFSLRCLFLHGWFVSWGDWVTVRYKFSCKHPCHNWLSYLWCWEMLPDRNHKLMGLWYWELMSHPEPTELQVGELHSFEWFWVSRRIFIYSYHNTFVFFSKTSAQCFRPLCGWHLIFGQYLYSKCKYFGDIAKDIYDNTLLLEGSTCSHKQDTFLDLYSRVVDQKFVTGIYHKADDFNFEVISYLFSTNQCSLDARIFYLLFTIYMLL